MTKENMLPSEFKGESWKTEVYIPKQDQWDMIGQDLTTIFNQAFSYVDFPLSEESTNEALQVRFDNPMNTNVLLRDTNDTIIGFSVAVPLMQYETVARSFIGHIRAQNRKRRSNEILRPYFDATRNSEANLTTAVIYASAITPLQQHKGLIGILMNRMEQELKTKGFTHLERSCVVDNGYAQKVFDFYNAQGRIEYASPEYKSDMGNQVHFRLRL